MTGWPGEKKDGGLAKLRGSVEAPRFREASLNHHRLQTALVVFGLALRCWHYLRNPSIWHDEAVLILNVIGKGFIDLLGPLSFDEAAPPLFLWIEKAVSLVLGAGPYALRLLPFLASCASLLLLAGIARRLLSPRAAPWAVLLFACSDHLLWHACEAKPYAVDVLCAAGLLSLYCRADAWPLGRRLLLYSLLAPLLIFFSYPGCFLYGGLLVAVLPEVWRRRRLGPWVGYAWLALVVVGSFTLLLLGPVRAQRSELMAACWERQFPPWERPWTVPSWIVFSTLEVVGYCCAPTGQALTVLAALGAVHLWHEGRRALVALLVVPIALALVGSCLGAYPYGGARVLVYAAPATVLLIAAGVPPVLSWLRPRSRLATLILLGLMLAPVAMSAYRLAVPWQRRTAPPRPHTSSPSAGHRTRSPAITGSISITFSSWDRRCSRCWESIVSPATAYGSS